MEKKADKQLTFGRRLSTARLEKGIDLSVVSKQIRVGRDILQHIENGDHAKLPDYVFVKGFIQAYADAIGLDRHEVLQLYKISYDHYQDALKAEADLAVHGTKFWRHLLSALSLVCVVILISFFMVTGLGNRTKEGVIEKMDSSTVTEGQAVHETQHEEVNDHDEEMTVVKDHPPVQESEEMAEKDQKQIPDDLHLKLTATEETWIKIIIDEETPRELILKPGDRKELKAEKQFNLLIGNAAGVKIDFNGKPVAIVGKSGQVTTLMLP